jgi:DNA-binding NarL/FixJ family response regulator
MPGCRWWKENKMNAPIRLLVVDDHALYREGVKAFLSTTPDIEVAGEASDGASALQHFRALRPQVVLMDIQMPGGSGIEAARTILSEDPQAGVIMVTMLEDDGSVFAAMRAGARGYVLKGAAPQEMLSVIRAVAEGQALFGPAIAARMARFFQEVNATSASPALGQPSTASPSPAPDAELAELSEREREVLDLIAAGYNNAEIAQKLVISPKTVRNHITSIFSKLRVADRAHAIRRARASPG